MEDSPRHTQTQSHVDLVASSLSGVLVSSEAMHTLFIIVLCMIMQCFDYIAIEETWIYAKKTIV